MSPDNLQLLRCAMGQYAELSDSTWSRLGECCRERKIGKNEYLTTIGSPCYHFYFVCQGLIRSFTVSIDGREYNKRFFPEHTFPGSIRALLKGEPSDFALQALEPSTLIEIDHLEYRRILESAEDLKWYHIMYLEKNWVLDKEPIEVGLALSDSKERYLTFLERYSDTSERIPLHHIASAIGVTPTQLSRIRRSIISK